MALDFRWLTFQQVNGLWHVAFHFRKNLRAPVLLSLFSFSFQEVTSTIFFFLHIFLTPHKLWGYSVVRWGCFNTLTCFFQLEPILSYVTLMSMPLSSHVLCLIFIITNCVYLFL